MVRHAYVHVPYYREAFDRAGVRPDDIQTLDDVRRLQAALYELLECRKRLDEAFDSR